MVQYIERAKVTDALIDNTSIVGSELEKAVNAICAIPAADVQPVRHGRWEEWWPGDCALILTGEEMLWMCSDCSAKVSNKSNFCPNCGAKMDKESEDV